MCRVVKSVGASWLQGLSVLAAIADVYASFIFWSLWSSFLQMLWYFPLWALGFSGYEVGGLLILSTCLLGWPWYRLMVYKLRSVYMLAAVILGIGAASNWQLFSSVPLTSMPAAPRIALVWLGLSLACHSQFSQVFMEADIWKFAQTLGSGLAVQMIVRLAFVTHIPFWPLMIGSGDGWVSFGFWTSIVVLSLRGILQFLRVGNTPKSIQLPSVSSLPAGVGLGALLFFVNELVIEPSTISHWTVRGHPDIGPFSLGWHILPILLAIGCTTVPTSASLPRWVELIFGVISSILFCELAANDYSYCGYSAGFCLIALALSRWPHIWQKLSRAPPGRSIFIGIMTYLILGVGQIYTVAFAFVPFGWYLREKSSWIFAIGSLLLFGLSKEKQVSRKFHRVWPSLSVILIVALCFRLYKPYYRDVSSVQKIDTNDYIGVPFNIQNAILKDLNGLPIVRISSTAVHFGIDNQLYSNDGRVVDVVRSMDLDFLGLVESDTMRSVMGHRDIIQRMGESLNYYVDYGPATSKATWGCSLLSRWPIVKSQHYLLPSPDGEIACAIYATVNVEGGGLLDVLMSHNGQEEDVIGRKLQTIELAKIVGQAKNPLIFSGYVVAKPHSQNYQYLFSPSYPESDVDFNWCSLSKTEGTLIDIKPDEGDRWCLYVGYRGPGVMRVGYSRLHHDGITDTEFQIGSFALLPTNLSATQKEAISLVIDFLKSTNLSKNLDKIGKYWKKWTFPEDPVCSSVYYRRSAKLCNHFYHTVVNFFQ